MSAPHNAPITEAERLSYEMEAIAKRWAMKGALTERIQSLLPWSHQKIAPLPNA